MAKDAIAAGKIYSAAKEKMDIAVRKNQLYAKEDNYWKCQADYEILIKIRALFEPDQQKNISSRAVKEAVEMLLQDPALQIVFTEEATERYLNLSNGIFDVETELLETPIEEKKFSYALDFSYLNKKEREHEAFDRFCETSFPTMTEAKKTLLLQILGYVISDYTGAKTGFFLMGESNTGKSVILEFLRKVMPENCVTAIPLYRLENRFNVARLADAKVNLSTETSEKSFKALDIYKMFTSNEMVTAEHKGKKPFEFQMRCKTVNAGNVLPHIDAIEGMDAVINRMTILIFPKSIEKEKQDAQLLEKLCAERDSIFSDAVDALLELRKNKFIFSEPEDTQKLKYQMRSRGKAVEEFLKDCCEMSPEKKVHLCDLYDAFLKYVDENLLDVKISKNQFTQKMLKVTGLSRDKFRIDHGKPRWGMKGIALKELGLSYDYQD